MNNTKRGLSILLSVIMVFTMLVTGFPSGLLTAMAAGETGTPDYIWYGDGSSTTYEIFTADELAGLADIVNGTNGQNQDDFKNKTITLTGDIDLSVYGKGASFNGGKGWIPIGICDDSFCGDFDGGNYEVTGLYINDEEGAYEYTGLFGDLLEGTVKNLRIIDMEINGGSYIGSLVGYLDGGSVENCYATGVVSGDSYIGGLVGYLYNGSAENCYATGNVSGSDEIGGLVGNLDGGSAEYCYATGVVSGDSYIGGLVGNLYNGSAENCYATGKVIGGDRYIGGLVGDLYESSVKNCYAVGDVSGGNRIGGLVGYLYGGSAENCVALNQNVSSNDEDAGRVVGWDSGTLEDNWAYADMDIKIGGENKAPLDNVHDKIDGADITMEEALTAAFWTDTMDWDGNDVWLFADGELPVFRLPHFTGLGTEQSPYMISTAEELAKLAELVNAGKKKYNTAHYLLENDIDLSGYSASNDLFNGGKGWIPIGTYSEPFRGVFDGGNHTVLGLYINDEEGDYEDTGLFGDVFVGTVKNLCVIDVEINGSSYVGGVVGYIQNDAVVENCYVSGKISGSELIGGVVGSGYGSVINCYSECDVSGNEGVGGLTGAIGGSVKNCYAIGDVTGESNIGGLVGNLYNGNVENCYTKGDVSGGRYTGGLVGILDGGSVKNCSVTGDVNGTSYCIGGIAGIMSLGNIENCNVIGDITGEGSDSYRVGGIAGEMKNSSVLNSYATGKVSSEGDCVGGAAGEVTSSLVENCYATGEISGRNAVGGITGKIDEFSTVQNCVALNPSVISNGDENDAGRVAGVCSGTLANNRAYDNMAITMEGEDKDPLDNVHDRIDGADITMEEALTAAFWTDTMDWEGNDVWLFNEGKLPVLKLEIWITAHPVSITITEGSSATLTVKAHISSDDDLIYQWYSNTTNSNSGGTAVDSTVYPTAASSNFVIPVNLTEGTYYYYCEVSTDRADSVCSDAATVTVNHTHAWETDWKSGADTHWHECSCGEKNDTAAHTPGEWIVDAAATETADGSRHKECTVCGYVTATEGLPVLSMIPTKAQFTCNLTAKTYNGKAQGVSVTSKGGVGKVTAVYYNKSKTVPTNAGSYVVTVDVAAGTQYGAVTGLSLGTFTINKADLSKIETAVADTVWTGKQIKPKEFTYNGIIFSISTNATVKSYGKNKDIGKGTITLVGKGNFMGTKIVAFGIAPKKNSVSKLTVGKKQMKVAWKKVSAAQKITKYEVRYRVKGTSKWNTKSYAASASTATIKNLKQGKQYEVQTRSYKTVSGKKYYSAWSTKKTGGKIK